MMFGGDNELLCHRIYVQARIYGGFWIVLEVTIDTGFYLFEKQTRHVTRSYYWQRRQYAKAKIQDHQVSTAETQEQTPNHQTNTP